MKPPILPKCDLAVETCVWPLYEIENGVWKLTYEPKKKLPVEDFFEFLRSITHLRSRTNALGAVARVRNTLSSAIHHFLQAQGFIQVHTPLITTSDCEGAGEMFKMCPATKNSS